MRQVGYAMSRSLVKVIGSWVITPIPHLISVNAAAPPMVSDTSLISTIKPVSVPCMPAATTQSATQISQHTTRFVVGGSPSG